jgi:hypothetical protein
MTRNIWRHATMALVLAASPLHARESPLVEASPSKPALTIPRLDHAPRLEDFLEMKPAPSAPGMTKIGGFIQHDPKDGAPAQQNTEVYIGYDTRNFYAVFVCFDNQPAKLRARMTRREDIGPEHDEIQLYLDTFNDRRRAYGFMINPLGIQYDFIWTESGGYDSSWDTVWESRGKITPQGYVALMAIPFKSLRFSSAKDQTWGILFERVVPHDNDNSFYPRVSASVQGRLSQEAELSGLEDIRSGRNIQLVPYGLADAYRTLDQRDPNHPFFTGKHLAGRAGLDGKFILKDSLVLDFTVNPDFRQLESDEPQNTANQRFEVFFPEKRPFFQEGANFFDTPINMYFTRRIEDPQFGLRLTGKLGPYGIGLLAADDRGPGQSVPTDDPLYGKRAYFTVGRLTRELWNRSQVGLFFSDREMPAQANSLCATDAPTTAQQIECVSNSNRVGGADFTFHFGDHLQAQGQALTATTDELGDVHSSGNLFSLYAEYSTRHIEYNFNMRDVSRTFITLPGFYQRPDIRRPANFFAYLFRPEGKYITSWGPHMYERTTYDHAGNRLEAVYEPGFDVHFKQNTDVTFYGGTWQELLRPSDYPTLSRNVNFNKGGYAGVIVSSNYFRWISLTTNLFTGKNLNFDPPVNQPPFLAKETQATLTATLHPLNRLTIANEYILERLTSTTSRAAIINSHIIRSKFNYQHNKELSFRAIFQYDALLANPLYTSLSQTKNFNSDFLITYMIHPGTAFYLGYNSNLENLDPTAISTHAGLVRNNSLINDGRTIYAKISYLFRF